MNRFNRFLETGEKPGEEGKSNAKGGAKGKGKGKGKAEEDTWIDTLQSHRSGTGKKNAPSSRHTFEVSRCPSMELIT